MLNLSVIICSRNQGLSDRLFKNIENTIGCKYELIIINNSQKNYSIFEAYNQGIEKSRGKYLCFIHDDVLFHTNGWGYILHRIFDEDSQIGLIGIAGTKLKTKMPSGWWDCTEDQKVINIIQHFPHKKKEKLLQGFDDSSSKEVVVIDGVFMAARKDNDIHFSENLNGFHNYDLNISFEYKKVGYKIIVTNELLVEHFSFGTLNEAWIKSTHKIHTLYQTLLPLKDPKSEISKETEIKNGKRFICESLKYQNRSIAFAVWIKLLYLNPVSGYHIGFWKTLIKNFKI
ncbi:glycosyltransferase [Zunongwangia sp. F260]|uniref:Glycosyltransferase n=1 Tax=Autumnicola lenta TaxID=3075593 RepID=A0ABU3CGC8_9FLAO|nr:glycosyltransferase [Zunongwangia sp. F260]MDT0645313.1 glycosyltransferase [Zunongwangia sp. F260]